MNNSTNRGNLPSKVFFSKSPKETEEIGIKIGKLLKKADIVALNGVMGAGKTCITRGIARGFGVTASVTSPTYTIINEYEAALPFFHVDAFRLLGADDFENSGGGEILDKGVCVIEWCEKIEQSLPPELIKIDITITDNSERKIIVQNFPKPMCLCCNE